MRRVLAAVGFALGWMAAACGSTFACEEDAQCEQAGTDGVCQPATGFCSFPSDTCESGQQYGELAPDGLAGTCVPSVQDTDSPTSDSGGEATGGPSSDADTSATSSAMDSTTMALDPDTSATSSGPGDDTSSDEGSSDEGTSGGPMSCCIAGCFRACAPGDQCPHELIGFDPPQDSEAIGVAVVGDQVVWSTGFGRSVMLADPSMGIDEELVAVPENGFVTRIAADDTHVYFLDWGGPTVRRASVATGTMDLVTIVPMGQAGFGGIAVDDTHVYFAMRSSGGVWRAAKDLSDQDGAQLVATTANPFGVALDPEYLFFIDSVAAEVRRIALDEIGMDDGGETVVTADGLTAIAVDDEALYFGADGQLARADKLGTNEGIENLASDLGNLWNIDVDEAHAYFTASSTDTVGRVAKDGASPVEVLALTPNPWGLALRCGDVTWAENGTQTLQRRPK